MSLKNPAIASAVVALAAVALVMTDQTGQYTAAVIPPTEAVAAADLQLQTEDLAVEAARLDAELSRQQVPAVVAARAEAQRVAEAQAAAAAAEAARAEAARQEAVRAEARQEAARAAAAAPAPASAPAPSSSRTTDYGVGASAYTGPMYNAGFESTRQCIVKKESGGNYGIVSSNGSYHGAYQFSRSTGNAVASRMGRGDLVGTPASSWSRYDQDMAFWTLWNNGAGRGNWPTARGC